MGCFGYRSRRASGQTGEKGAKADGHSSSSLPDISPTSSGAQASFFDVFFDWVRSHIPNIRNKTHKSCPAAEISARRSASQGSKVHGSPKLRRSSASSSVDPTIIADANSVVSQQVPEIVENGLRVRVGSRTYDEHFTDSVLVNNDPSGEIPIGDAGRFSEENLCAIQSGLLDMKLESSEGPPVELIKYQSDSTRIKTLVGGKSNIRSTLPLYSARHGRPDAENPTACVYVEARALWDMGLNGSVSIAFSVPNFVGIVGSDPGSLAYCGGNGCLYYNKIPLELESEPFTSGSVGLGLLLQYKKAHSTAAHPTIDIKVFHTRDDRLIKVITLNHDMLGFDGFHDLFVDVQTVDKTEFRVVFEKRWWKYTPVKSQLMLLPSGMESGSNISI